MAHTPSGTPSSRRARLGAHLRSQLVAYLALVVALGGTSYAAVVLQPGQVKNKHLAKNAVTTNKLKNHTVRSSDIKNAQVKAVDLAAGAVDPAVWGISLTLSASNPFPFASANGNVMGQTLISVPRPGRLLVRLETTAYVDCTSGTPTVGLYIDGNAAPFTQVSVPDQTSTPVRMITTVEGVEAGPVGINAKAHCLNGTHFGSSFAAPHGLTALLVQP